MHTILQRGAALACAATLALAGCGDDDDGGGEASVEAYCDKAAELRDMDGRPSDADLDEIAELAPDEISDDVDTFLGALGDDEPTEEVLAAVQAIDDFEAANCTDA